MNFSIIRILYLLFFVSAILPAGAQSQIIEFNNQSSKIDIGTHVEICIDETSSLPIGTIKNSGKFFHATQPTPVFFLNDKTLWARFNLVNRSDFPTLFFSIPYPNIAKVELYQAISTTTYKQLYISGNKLPFANAGNRHVDYNFELSLPKNTTGTYYLKIKSQHPVELRLILLTANEMNEEHTKQSIIMAAYLGVIGSILLYNLFLFFATRDRSYIIYVVYLFLLALAQLTFAGWAFKYFWPSVPYINRYAVIWTTSLASMAALAFAFSFLHIRAFLPRTYQLLLGILLLYVLAVIVSFSPYRYIAYQILNFNSVASGVLLIYASARINAKGYRPALFYLFAWSAFLIGVLIFVFRNIGFLPVNLFTTYVLYAGSAIETILLSIALADKIAVLRKEKENSQADALRVAQENEQLVKEQNVLLERKVKERTIKLEEAGNQVRDAFKELKDAQIQLVESEKMASLGQLTTGIAHEINNPINFVKSNIKPLQLDFKDLIEVINEYDKLHQLGTGEIAAHLKQIEQLKRSIDLDFVKGEIDSLMKGIENGAERTAEIVRGLRTFSRLDESVIKTVNIHEGINSTLILLRSNIPVNIAVIKEYEADGNVECFPGKLNQVFMNILSNAVQAIKGKPEMSANESIVIRTRDISPSEIEIRIKDSGLGMPKEVKQKIFDPFFTTKEVGEGTGLGLAIVFKIIQEHAGKIEVNSTEGEGSEFVITLSHLMPGKPKI